MQGAGQRAAGIGNGMRSCRRIPSSSPTKNMQMPYAPEAYSSACLDAFSLSRTTDMKAAQETHRGEQGG